MRIDLKAAVLEEFPDRLELSFYQSFDWCVDARYSNYGKRIDLPVGHKLSVVEFVPSKGCELYGVELIDERKGKRWPLYSSTDFSSSLPIVEPSVLAVCFPDDLDLTGCYGGDWQWGITNSFNEKDFKGPHYPRLLIRHLLVKVYPLKELKK